MAMDFSQRHMPSSLSHSRMILGVLVQPEKSLKAYALPLSMRLFPHFFFTSCLVIMQVLTIEDLNQSVGAGAAPTPSSSCDACALQRSDLC
jgi:hypothetical protein